METADRNPFEVLGQLESQAISIIGYQLWTPLSAIKACLELMALPADEESGDRHFMLELALQEMEGLDELIRECLALFASIAPADELTERDLQLACPLHPTLELLRDALLDVRERSANSELSRTEPEQWALATTDSTMHAEMYEPITKDSRVKTAEEQVEFLKQLRSKLIAIVGHELRTPLCSLQVCLETFLNEPKQFSKADRQTLLELARKDLNRLHQLVQKFFTLSRLERGLILHERELVDLQKTLELVSSGFQNLQSLDVPSIVIDVPCKLPLVQVDEDKLVLALMQLLENASQFTGAEGKVTIEARKYKPTAREHNTEDELGMVEIVVADTGCGIAPERLEKVFDCFYQEEDFLRRSVGGTGIGLSICRKLIEAMGGKIWAQSLGKSLGSRIHLTLPAEDCRTLKTVAG